MKSETDWTRVKAMTFEDVEESIKDDPDMAGFLNLEKLTVVKEIIS
jgi:hypothetical protein